MTANDTTAGMMVVLVRPQSTPFVPLDRIDLDRERLAAIA
jgi:hypothetical protein